MAGARWVEIGDRSAHWSDQAPEHGRFTRRKQPCVDRPPDSRPPRTAELGFVGEVGTQDRNLGLELRQNGVRDAQCLPGFLISPGQQVFVVHRLPTERAAKPVNKLPVHGSSLLTSHPAPPERGWDAER